MSQSSSSRSGGNCGAPALVPQAPLPEACNALIPRVCVIKGYECTAPWGPCCTFDFLPEHLLGGEWNYLCAYQGREVIRPALRRPALPFEEEAR